MVAALIGLGIGAVAGGISTYLQGEKEKEQIKRQKDLAWNQYLAGKDLSDLQYSTQQGEAMSQLAL
jgi:hypothetical protein